MKFILLAAILFHTVCSFGQNANRNDFADVLSLKNKVTNIKDIENTFFCDLGAWHGYALPQDKNDYGSFIGPVVMDLEGYWISNTLTKLNLSEDGYSLDLAGAKYNQTYYPGLLQQTFKIDQTDVEQRLIFSDNRTALIETKITNTGANVRKVDVSFAGSVLVPTKFKSDAGRLLIYPANTEHLLLIEGGAGAQVSTLNNTLTIDFGSFSIGPGESIRFVLTQAYYLNEAECGNESAERDFDSLLKVNEKRWNKYINDYFKLSPNLSEEEKMLAVKCIITLISNWRSAAKDILHDGVFPSVNYQGFYGVWSWDSWKQAVGLTLFHPDLAKDNIRAMFDYMNDDGMIPDCIYAIRSENNWRDTKPPLAAWAVWNVVNSTSDRAFANEMYGKLVRYHEWWYNNRDNDGNRLCEYGSTDGTRIAAAWESGMDNAVRFDSSRLIKINEGAWSLDQESVDLNSYLYAEKIYLSRLAGMLGKVEDRKRYLNESKLLREKINTTFFDVQNGFYYDHHQGKNSLMKIEGTEGWIPLWAGIADKAQASKVISMMRDKNKFNTTVPLPTLTADHSSFDPLDGYWRGPVWLDQFYFGVVGLNKYGRRELSTEFVNRLLNNAKGIFTTGPLCENYHPITGECLNAKNFSWSAAHILMLLAMDQVK